MVDKAKDLLSINLKRLRESKGWTQSDLAEKSRLSVKMIQKVEYGQTSPSTDTLDAISKALKEPLSALFESVGPSSIADLRPQFSDAVDLLQHYTQASAVRRLSVLFLLSKDESYLDRLRALPGTTQLAQVLSKVPKAL